jgi:two-component system sensor histidine kinase YesM
VFYTLQADQRLVTSMDEIDSADPGIQSASEAYVRDTLTTTFVDNSQTVDALNLYIYSEHKLYTVDSANSGAISQLDIRTTPWRRMLTAPVNLYFRQESDGLYAFHSMNRFEDHKLFGGISVRLNEQAWAEISTILNSGLGSPALIFNDAQQLLSGSAPTNDLHAVAGLLHDASLQDSALVVHKTASDLYLINRLEDGLLTVVKPIPLESIDQSAQPTIRAAILTGGIFAAVSILLSIVSSLLISRPIVSLARLMRATTISSYETKPVDNRDEIGLLESAYHVMMQRIVDLVEVEYLQELEVKNAQLMALQAQINPHFVNNVLNLIGGMALKRNAPEIYQVILVVRKLLQYSVSSAGDMVSLGDELEHTRNYLFIQEERFAGRCKVSISADDTALAHKLPKFTLQPVVENAFEHGLQRKEGAWNVAVRVICVRGRVCIIVRDDGVGIPPERLRSLRTELKEGGVMKVELSRGTGIGLRNVNSRLKLKFGDTCGVRLFSTQGVGTLVAIVVRVDDPKMAPRV